MILLLFGGLFIAATPALSRPPVFITCPNDTIWGSACDFFRTQVQAVDYDPPSIHGALSYILIKGPGKLNSRTGEWAFRPSGKDLGKTFQVEIAAWDGEIMTNGAQNCRFWVVVAPNHPPRISLDTYECGSSFSLYAPGSKSVSLYAYDLDDCDQAKTFLESITPEPAGHVSLGDSWGLTFVADSLDADKTFLVNIAATDGIDTTYCEITFVTHSIEPYCVRIEKTHDTYQGMHEYVDVTLESVFGPLGGFDFLLAYDASALNFQMAESGDLYNQCDWEYFTYRYGPFGGCGSDCPSGMLRVVSIAEINNGPYHPSCFLPDSLPAALFTLDFLVTGDPIYECDLIPISFFWCDCGDNTIASRFGDTLFMSRSVYDADGVDIAQDDSLPTYFGTPSECLDNPNPSHPRIRLIDFYNGSVQIMCAEPIDDRGDVNLNGRPYEIADMVMFTNYFVYGTGVFHINQNAQIAATDMNCDGLTLDIADLVYGVRVIAGDALPPEYLEAIPTHTARFIQDFETKTIEVNTPDTLGAAHLMFEGANRWSEFFLLQSDMEMKYSYSPNEDVTHVLIYSLEGNSFTQGPLLSYENAGVLIEASAAAYHGSRVRTSIERRGSPGYPSEYLPASFTLYQNYPNPFNSTTSIRFDLSHDNHVEFQVINMLGQIVYTVRRHYLAGWHQIDWNGTDNSGSQVASGIYYYRLKTADFTDSKKMILLK